MNEDTVQRLWLQYVDASDEARYATRIAEKAYIEFAKAQRELDNQLTNRTVGMDETTVNKDETRT